MEKKRVIKRRHLFYYLEVYDLDQDIPLGRLVDITTRGFKLVSRKQIPAGRTYQLKMLLPADLIPARQLIFSGTSLWSSNEVNPDFYDTGFEIDSLDLKERKIILQLIDQIGFID